MSAISKTKFEEKIATAKRAARSELNNISNSWQYHDYANTLSLSPSEICDNCPRIDVKEVSYKEFVEKFEIPKEPVVLLNTQCRWLAKEKWKPHKLAQKYRNQVFKVGEDDKGSSVKLKMKYYVEYMKNNQDDSPLYIFDSNYGEHRKKKKLLEDYEIPEFFADDLFRYAGERKRPPHRWLVMGPPRSGTGIHIDPLGTSAWNALVHGHKRWCLISPEAPRSLVKLKHGEGWKNRAEAVTWFKYVYPRAKAENWPEQYRVIEIYQKPGETVYVPGGWWHVVLNLDDTVAVTQNLMAPSQFEYVYRKTILNRPRLARKIMINFRIARPEFLPLAQKVHDVIGPDEVASSSSSDNSTSSATEASDMDSDTDSDQEGVGDKASKSNSSVKTSACAPYWPERNGGSRNSTNGDRPTKQAKMDCKMMPNGDGPQSSFFEHNS